MRMPLDRMDGIGRKVSDQIRMWAASGVDARILVFVDVPGQEMDAIRGWKLNLASNSSPFLVRKAQRVFQFLKGALITVLWRPDVIYTRAGVSFWGSSMWKWSGAKRVIELNTTLEGELVSLQKTGHINEREQDLRREDWNQTMQKADAYVSVSDEIDRQNKQWMADKPATVVCNSIDFSKHSKVIRKNQQNKLPKLVFVGAAEYDWNGVDKLMYLASKTVGILEFVLIGVKPDKTHSENVTIYPFLEKEKLPEILASCDVGVATLALHRKELEEASPLKVREYAALGLPMIIAYNETAFKGVDTPEWVLRIPNKEKSVEIFHSDIIAFSKKWKGRCIAPVETSPFFHAGIVEQKRVQFFDEIC